MPTAEPNVTFRDLFAYTDYLALRWLDYFEQNPDALNIDIGGKTGVLRNLVTHIFQVEEYFAERLHKGDAPRPQDMPAITLAELRRMHNQAQLKLIDYLRTTTREHLNQKQTFASATPSNHKILAQTALHGVHHWAQVAMAIRQAGFPTTIPQDIIISPVME